MNILQFIYFSLGLSHFRISAENFYEIALKHSFFLADTKRLSYKEVIMVIKRQQIWSSHSHLRKVAKLRPICTDTSTNYALDCVTLGRDTISLGSRNK